MILLKASGKKVLFWYTIEIYNFAIELYKASNGLCAVIMRYAFLSIMHQSITRLWEDFLWWEGLSKNVDHHGWPTTKEKLAKAPKTARRCLCDDVKSWVNGGKYEISLQFDTRWLASLFTFIFSCSVYDLRVIKKSHKLNYYLFSQKFLLKGKTYLQTRCW